MKVCNQCNQLQSLDCFSKKLNGKQPLCKKCASRNHKNWYAKSTNRTVSQMGNNNRTKMSGKIIDGKKLCSRCEEWKLVCNFYSKSMIKFEPGPWCKECSRLYSGIRNIISRMEFLIAYGGKCICCGETCVNFLTVEHIRNKGHKLIYGSGTSFINKLKEQGWPKGYTVLCWNCNMSSKGNMPCIHSEEYKAYNRKFEAFLIKTNRLDEYNRLVNKLKKIKMLEGV